MAEMMKEVVVVEPHKYEVREVEIPELANEDEVLIQMKSAGVCGSDHHIWHGSNPCSTYPRIPGHENAGVIAKIGKNVKNVKWVTMLSWIFSPPAEPVTSVRMEERTCASM